MSDQTQDHPGASGELPHWWSNVPKPLQHGTGEYQPPGYPTSTSFGVPTRFVPGPLNSSRLNQALDELQAQIGSGTGGGGGGLGDAPSDGSSYGRLNAAWAKVLALTGGTLTGPLNVTASGGNTVRSVQANFGDIANVLDYGAGIGGDDAAAIRAAVASGKRHILIPPGDYTMKSTVSTGAPASNSTCILFSGVSNLAVFAYGARFLIANSISTPPKTTVAFANDCKHIGWFGGTFVGNNTGLSTTDENVAFECNSTTFLTLRDIKITGSFLTAFAGTWLFDCTFQNILGYNTVNAIDMAHIENVVFQRCMFAARPSLPVTGASIHYDVPTLSGNHVTTEAGTPRALVGGCTNQLRFLDCLFDGYANGIAIDCVRGALISRTVVRNGLVASSANIQAGVLLYHGSAALSAGLPTTNIMVEDCEVYGNGVTAGGGVGCGVYIEATQVSVFNSRISDNTNYGIATSNPTNVRDAVVMGCDFRSRTGGTLQLGGFDPTYLRSLLSAPGSIWGTARNNLGGVSAGTDYLMVEGISAVGVADSGSKTATLRLTSNQTTGNCGGGVEFGGVRAASGLQASGYFAALKGSLVGATNNTTGTLDIYVRKLDTDTALTQTGSFTSTGLTIGDLRIIDGGGPTVRAGPGAPVGVQPSGSLWMRIDGGVGTGLYISSGAGVWTAVPDAAGGGGGSTSPGGTSGQLQWNSAGSFAGTTISGDATLASSTGVLTLANTTVTPGSYTATNITVDAKGRITAAANGAGGGGITDAPSNGTTYGRLNAAWTGVLALTALAATAPIMDGTAAAGTAVTVSRSDHVHPTDTSRYATTNPSGYQTAAQVTAAVPVASSTTPVMDGTAAIGAGTTWARSDHVHPTDTSRYAATNPSGYQTAAQVAAAVVASVGTPVAFGIDFSQGAVVVNGTIIVIAKAPFALTINSMDYAVGSAAGSFTVAVKIAGTNVTGLSAVAVSSATSANAAATAANTVTAGQAITVVISATTGSPTGGNLQINGTR